MHQHKVKATRCQTEGVPEGAEVCLAAEGNLLENRPFRSNRNLENSGVKADNAVEANCI